MGVGSDVRQDGKLLAWKFYLLVGNFTNASHGYILGEICAGLMGIFFNRGSEGSQLHAIKIRSFLVAVVAGGIQDHGMPLK